MPRSALAKTLRIGHAHFVMESDKIQPDKNGPLATFFVGTLIVMLCGSFFVFRTGAFGEILQTDARQLIGTASIVILLALVAMYSYMATFYQDHFYVLVGLGWLANAFYVSLESFQSRPDQNAIWVLIFAQISFIPFYLAASCSNRGCNYWRGLVQVALWFAFIVLFVLGWWYVITRSNVNDSVRDLLAPATLGCMAYSVAALIQVGRASARRLSRERNGVWAIVLPYTFYFYAGLQLLLPIKIANSSNMYRFAVGIFLIAITVKILNGVSAAVALSTDFNNSLKRQSALEELGALTASIEHDILNPLNLANGLIESMKARFQANAEILHGLDRIREQHRRMFASTEIVEILRGGRDYYGRFLERRSVNEIVARSVRAVKGAKNTDSISFPINDTSNLYVMAYPPLLQQAFENILRNAIEAIREANRRSGIVRIDLRKSGESGDRITIEFSDNGLGIPMEYRSKLGHLFTTKSDKKPNSGIGLFISTRILQFHDGRLEIGDAKNGGAKVTVILPAAKA